MQLSNWIIFGAAEVFAVLLLVCAFLLFHSRGLKNLVIRLQQKLAELARDLKKSRKAYKQLKASIKEPASYDELVEEQLQHTREHHQSLDPDQDIVLDLTSDAPLPRQIASLRHAFLVTEKEAALSSDDEQGRPNWNVIQAKFNNLLNFFKAETPDSANIEAEPADSEELDALREALAEKDERIANLEKFKQLFFELEDKWDAAQNEASNYHQQLSNFQVTPGEQDNFEGLLDQYRNVYNEFGGNLTPDDPKIIEKQSIRTIEVPVERGPTQGEEEINRLRSITANQHQLINQLEARLSQANSTEEKVQIINDLQDQLARQQRNMQEFETCVELMEAELNQANQQVEQLQDQVDRMEKRSEQNATSVKQARALQQERAKMERSVLALEQENEQLVNQLQSAMSSGGSGGSDSASQELKQLQRQYTELESKYLALRMK